MIRAKLIAKGRVQGVNYRAFVCSQADSLDVKGTVKNLPDGSVEIIAEAPDEKTLEEFKQRVKHRSKWGPQVDELVVEKQEKASQPTYFSFDITY
ncbi:acylphosphatase [Candidatus Micrarchaeota archaeon]|nr:MAG: acylphosphatase [Candidatus Micrarchaeota archaeon]